MTRIHISDIEAAINFWRMRDPAANEAALAEVLERLVHDGVQAVDEQTLTPAAMQAWLQWYDSTPDTPCIAICSTSQGDEICKGCGRTFAEVQHWTTLDPVRKRAVWQRITQDGSAWRFNRYAERALEKRRPKRP